MFSINIKVKTKNITTGLQDCGLLCLKHCGFVWDDEKLDSIKENILSFVNRRPTDTEESLMLKYKNVIRSDSVESLIIIINYFKLSINIIGNGLSQQVVEDKKLLDTFNLKENLLDGKIVRKSRVCKPSIVDSIFSVACFTKEYDSNGELVMVDREFCIVYDDQQKHFDVCKTSTPTLLDNVLVSVDGKIAKDGKIIMTSRMINENIEKAITINQSERRYIIFDYETVVDFDRSNCCSPYQLSIMDVNLKELEQLDKIEKGLIVLVGNDFLFDDEANANQEDIVKVLTIFRKIHCLTFTGFDSSRQFINWIKENQMDKSFVFIGFNNSNFDNFLLLETLLTDEDVTESAAGGVYELGIDKIFYNGSQLLNFRLSGRHETFDIRKHLVGTLANCCKSFKIKHCAKQSLDHDKMQVLYEEGRLLDYITSTPSVTEYNEFDVISTGLLFFRYKKALEDIPLMRECAANLTTHKTIGSMIYGIFSAKADKKKIKLPKLSYEHYLAMSTFKIAGRVELFNGLQNIMEEMASLDVCSLYPYIMAICNHYFPCGKVVEVNSYQGDDEIGFYYCDIDQSILKTKNLPLIYARKTKIENQWDFEGLLENYFVSNVMIGLLLKHGCTVTIRNGIIFSDKRKSCEMFDFVNDLMIAKNLQDSYKDSKNVHEQLLYNAAMRETCKLLMNSVSGKVIEGLHLEKTESVNSIEEYQKIVENSVSINVVNAIGGKVFVTYKKDEEKECVKSQKPIYLGILIYDYSKRYMYEMSYSKIGKNNLVYTDTDASKFRKKDFHAWKDWIDRENVLVPHWPEIELVDPRYKTHKLYESNSKVFGSFEDELAEFKGESFQFMCLEKKSWMYQSRDISGKIVKSKFCFKGLNANAHLLTLEEDIVESTTNSAGTKYSIIKKCKVQDDKAAYNWSVKNPESKIGCADNVRKFFTELYTTGESYLLCQSFRKVVKNSKRNVTLEDSDKFNNLANTIQLCFQIKHISIKPKTEKVIIKKINDNKKLGKLKEIEVEIESEEIVFIKKSVYDKFLANEKLEEENMKLSDEIFGE